MEEAGWIAVADTSPLIALVSVDAPDVLDGLFERVAVPASVWGELSAHEGAVEPIHLRALRCFELVPDASEVLVAAERLGSGEKHVLGVALTMPGGWVMLDDTRARSFCMACSSALVRHHQ